MTKVVKRIICVLASITVFFMVSCHKPSDIQPPPVVDTTLVNAMYPSTRVDYQGSNSRTEFKYEYDKDNHLIKYGLDDVSVRLIGSNVVNDNIYQKNANSVSVLSATRSYVFTLAGLPNTAVNIYSSVPTQVDITDYNKNPVTGATTSRVIGRWQFETGKDNLWTKEITSDGGGLNYNNSYDAKGNLKMIEFVSLSGPRAGALYNRLTVTSVDDKPSPFSQVKGYRAASYPAVYAKDYALAYCKNNPLQIIIENYDADKNAFVLGEQDDFTYTYNPKGYPASITINTTYFRGTTTHYTETFVYTYK